MASRCRTVPDFDLFETPHVSGLGETTMSMREHQKSTQARARKQEASVLARTRES